MIQIQKEILKWTKLNAIENVQRLAEQKLPTEQDKKIFDLTDGIKTVREIAKITGVNKDAVSRKWKEWFKAGLLEKEGKKGYKKIFDLAEVGVESGV